MILTAIGGSCPSKAASNGLFVTFNDPGTGRLGSAGRPLEGVEVRLAESESGEPGEVLVRGPNVFAGYQNLPDKTDEVFTSDGFFRTGDRGHFDDGHLMLTGRVGSLIKLGAGEKILPERIEEMIGTSKFITPPPKPDRRTDSM